MIASEGEVWGRYRKRAVSPELPLPPPQALDASQYGPTELSPVVRRLLAEGGRVDVVNVLGHRYLGNGMQGGVLKLWGIVGNASGNVMEGGEMYIYGDAQEDLGDAMNGGLIAVYGNVGDAVGQAKRGGVTHPSVDPYREDLEVSVRIGPEEYHTPVVVPAIDDAAVLAAYALGAPIYGKNAYGLRHIDEGAVVVPPGHEIDVASGVVVIDERLGGGLLEEAVTRLDLNLRQRGVRGQVYIVAVGRLYNGGDIYKLAALGADLVAPLGIFEHVKERVKHMELRARMVRYENVISALTKELRLLMGANGVTSYYHTLVGNRDLLRSLDGRIAKLLGVEVAGK